MPISSIGVIVIISPDVDITLPLTSAAALASGLTEWGESAVFTDGADDVTLIVTIRETVNLTLFALPPVDLTNELHLEIVREATSNVTCADTLSCTVSLVGGLLDGPTSRRRQLDDSSQTAAAFIVERERLASAVDALTDAATQLEQQLQTKVFSSVISSRNISLARVGLSSLSGTVKIDGATREMVARLENSSSSLKERLSTDIPMVGESAIQLTIEPAIQPPPPPRFDPDDLRASDAALSVDLLAVIIAAAVASILVVLAGVYLCRRRGGRLVLKHVVPRSSADMAAGSKNRASSAAHQAHLPAAEFDDLLLSTDYRPSAAPPLDGQQRSRDLAGIRRYRDFDDPMLSTDYRPTAGGAAAANIPNAAFADLDRIYNQVFEEDPASDAHGPQGLPTTEYGLLWTKEVDWRQGPLYTPSPEHPQPATPAPAGSNHASPDALGTTADSPELDAADAERLSRISEEVFDDGSIAARPPEPPAGAFEAQQVRALAYLQATKARISAVDYGRLKTAMYDAHVSSEAEAAVRTLMSVLHTERDLLIALNEFLPQGYRVEFPQDGSPWLYCSNVGDTSTSPHEQSRRPPTPTNPIEGDLSPLPISRPAPPAESSADAAEVRRPANLDSPIPSPRTPHGAEGFLSAAALRRQFHEVDAASEPAAAGSSDIGRSSEASAPDAATGASPLVPAQSESRCAFGHGSARTRRQASRDDRDNVPARATVAVQQAPAASLSQGQVDPAAVEELLFAQEQLLQDQLRRTKEVLLRSEAPVTPGRRAAQPRQRWARLTKEEEAAAAAEEAKRNSPTKRRQWAPLTPEEEAMLGRKPRPEVLITADGGAPRQRWARLTLEEEAASQPPPLPPPRASVLGRSLPPPARHFKPDPPPRQRRQRLSFGSPRTPADEPQSPLDGYTNRSELDSSAADGQMLDAANIGSNLVRARSSTRIQRVRKSRSQRASADSSREEGDTQILPQAQQHHPASEPTSRRTSRPTSPPAVLHQPPPEHSSMPPELPRMAFRPSFSRPDGRPSSGLGEPSPQIAALTWLRHQPDDPDDDELRL